MFYSYRLFAAANDVQAIEALAQISAETHSEVIAFHAQQASEKVLKHVFAEHGEAAPKTHAVDELLARAVELGWLSEEALACSEAAANLTQFAVLARYTQARDIGVGEALQAMAGYKRLVEMLEKEGYAAVPLAIPAQYLRESAETQDADEPENDV